MTEKITSETIEYVAILSKLFLSEEDKIESKKDMNIMLDYINMLNALDTDGVEPMISIFPVNTKLPVNTKFPVNNIVREDEITNGDQRDEMLFNAPQKKDNCFKVPKIIE